MSAQRRLFQFFFFSPTFRAQSGHVSDTPHKYSNREQESVSSTPQNSKQTRFSLSLSLSQIETKSKEGRRHRWRRLLCSPSPLVPRSSAGVQNPSREAEEEEARRRRGRRLLHRMRRRGTRTTTRRRKRHPPRTNARINRVKVKCGGQTLLLLLLLR